MALRSLPSPRFLSYLRNPISRTSSSCTQNAEFLIFHGVYGQNPSFSGGVFSKGLCQFGRQKYISNEKKNSSVEIEGGWGKVSEVLFDMDGVLCNSEVPSRIDAVDVFAEMGIEVSTEDFVPFTVTGELNFLGGVASAKGVMGSNVKHAKTYSGIGFPEAYGLIDQSKSEGLKVALASSADRMKVEANLRAAGLPLSMSRYLQEKRWMNKGRGRVGWIKIKEAWKRRGVGG